MNLNMVEWAQTQGLLVELVQALTPLTFRLVPLSLFLSRRFLPPAKREQENSQERSFGYSVRLLTTLQSVQKQVGELLKKEQPAFRQEMRSWTPREKGEMPIAQHAHRLIAEVQHAIGKLSSSQQIHSPQEALIQEELLKLKPALDQMVEAVVQLHEKALHKKAPLRPLPSRISHQKQEPVPLSQETPTPKLLTPHAKPLPKPFLHFERPKKEGRGEVIFPPAEIKKGVLPLQSTESEPASEKTISAPLLQKTSAVPTTLFAAPFIPTVKTLIHPSKKKKKRFWGKEKQEDENNS